MQAWTEIAHHFSTQSVAHLATLEADGSPQVVPLWIDRHGEEELVFFTTAGSRKDRNVTRDPRVAVSITAPEDAYVMATVRGEVVARIDGDEGMAIVDRLSQQYTGTPYPVREGFVAFVIRPKKWWSRDFGADEASPS
ncbi:TIGR03618 family F420-dependent PPOX class oxidoreductase [Agrococcus sp. ARC_14]|uniref:TIGR03618 family F420-dependent PPOX class oxidoreductase n=1 Tax=Agrococcus sp. ARC_14 TaxID=2919927 RepID=UPI001F0519FB|nr:TIGR03618 family F420-dependent PPOX class oxidoreductase [Agrococcus sp. ARC_14]MCH1881939.1 TIGR03618 family F420-dependent PPOX class oxidoreductase [Agrococcus sp. ARC_14]